MVGANRLLTANTSRERRTLLGAIAAWSIVGAIFIFALQPVTCFKWVSSPYLSWGSLGISEGQFNSPNDMAINASGHVYITDTGNNRVQVFTQTGQYLFQWGTAGTGDGQFYSPRGIAINGSGHVYVTDAASRVQVFTQNGQYLYQWLANLSCNNQNPLRRIAINGSGNVYVWGMLTSTIQVFTQTGQRLFNWGFSQWNNDSCAMSIQFDAPFVINSTGHVYVSSRNGQIMVYTQTGQFLFSWEYEHETINFFLDSSRGIAIDTSGQIYVTDKVYTRLLVFSQSGSFLNILWQGDACEFYRPAAITINATGSILILDEGLNRVRSLPPSGPMEYNFLFIGLVCSLMAIAMIIIGILIRQRKIATALGQQRNQGPLEDWELKKRTNFVHKRNAVLCSWSIIRLFLIFVDVYYGNTLNPVEGEVLGILEYGAFILFTLGIMYMRNAIPLNKRYEPIRQANAEKRRQVKQARLAAARAEATKRKLEEEARFAAQRAEEVKRWQAEQARLAAARAEATKHRIEEEERLAVQHAEETKRLQAEQVRLAAVIIEDEKHQQGEQGYHLQTTQHQIFTAVQANANRDNTPSPNAVQKADIETHVIIKRQYEYIAGKVRIKINVANTGSQGHLRLKVGLDLPQSFRLLRVEPAEYTRDGSTIKLGDLLPREEKSAAWVLEPLICGREKIGGTVSGVDADGTPFAAPMAPLEVEVRCPLFVLPEEANLPVVQRMLSDLPVHSDRSFLLPETLAAVDAFELAKGVIAERDLRLVGTFTGVAGQSFDQSAVFYGVTKVKQKRFVITASVSEADRAIRISSACDEEDMCTGLLAEAGASVRRALVARGAVDSEAGVVELVCEKCGATLPQAPIIGRDVICPECRWPWRVSDFIR